MFIAHARTRQNSQTERHAARSEKRLLNHGSINIRLLTEPQSTTRNLKLETCNANYTCWITGTITGFAPVSF
jgi:hypothetical protein